MNLTKKDLLFILTKLDDVLDIRFDKDGVSKKMTIDDLLNESKPLENVSAQRKIPELERTKAFSLVLNKDDIDRLHEYTHELNTNNSSNIPVVHLNVLGLGNTYTCFLTNTGVVLSSLHHTDEIYTKYDQWHACAFNVILQYLKVISEAPVETAYIVTFDIKDRDYSVDIRPRVQKVIKKKDDEALYFNSAIEALDICDWIDSIVYTTDLHNEP